MLCAVQPAAFDARDRWVNQVWREYNRLDENWPTQNRTAVPRIGDDSIQLALGHRGAALLWGKAWYGAAACLGADQGAQPAR